MSFFYAVFGIFAVVTSVGLYVFGPGMRPKGYPPGPPTLPIVGNLHQIPGKNEYLKFHEWAKKYGPIYSIFVGSQPMIVLSSGEIVRDLLKKRGSIYSSRPEFYVVKHLPMGKVRMLLMAYGPTWRALRKVTHTLLGVTAAIDYVPYQILERKQMLQEMVDDPDNFFFIIRRYTTSIATTLTFGWRTPTNDDARATRLFEELDEMQALMTTSGAALLDAFPILRYLPDIMLPMKARAQRANDVAYETHMSNWNTVKKDIANGSIRPCFSVGLAEVQKREGFSDSLAAHTAGTMFEAGAETTLDTLYAFVQAMLLFPDVQAKAQEEIDRVVGSGRLPTMDDAHDLPYIRCCVKESLRWLSVGILGAAPHCTTREDTYMGYTIPKGVAVLNNIYAIHQDEERYPEPRRFWPERFENDNLSIADSAAHPDPSKRDTYAFGAGRRVCPGMHVADRSLFLGLSGIIWAFDIRPKKDLSGKDIMPDPEDLIVGITAIPAPYEADIRPRSEKKAEILTSDWEDAKELLDPVTMQWKETPVEVRLKGLQGIYPNVFVMYQFVLPPEETAQ